MNEDKALARKELFTKFTNPRPAANMDDLNKALEDWETSKRLFVEADGKLPEDSNERLAFIDMLPPDVSANVGGEGEDQRANQTASSSITSSTSSSHSIPHSSSL